MNKIINVITVSFLLSNLIYDFQINRGPDNSTPSFPESNGIIDIEGNPNTDNIIWVTTGSGLGKITVNIPSLTFEGVDNSNLPSGGNPALFSQNNI